MALTPLRVNPPTKGVNTTTPIRELSHEYAVTLDNVWMDKAGSIQARPGQAQIIPPHTNAIKKVFEYVTLAGSTILMMQDSLGGIYRQSGAGWLSAGAGIYAGTLSVKQLGAQLILGDGTTMQYYNGSSLWNAAAWTVPAGIFPSASFDNRCSIFSPHNGRMYGAGSSALRTVVFFSDVLATGMGASAGVADWTINVAIPAVGGFIDVSGATGSGDAITGITSFQGLLVIFTSNSIVFYNANNPLTSLSTHKVIHGIGCISHESIAGIGNNTIFLSQYGFLSLKEVLVQGDAAAEKSSVAINNFIVERLRNGFYNPANISATYSQSLGIYLCSFGSNQSWAYHELFGGWMPWYGVLDKLFVASSGVFYTAGLETAILSANNREDLLAGIAYQIDFTWETAPFRSAGQEIKARWNKLEVIYEAEPLANISISAWLNLDKAQSVATTQVTLTPASIVSNPTGMKWAKLLNGVVQPVASNIRKWGGLANALASNWAGVISGLGLVKSGSSIIPLVGRSELLTLSISNLDNKGLKITALEVYRNDGGLRE